MSRIAEAELWGDHDDLHVEDGLAIRCVRGTYGTLYEVQCWSMWRLWRLHAVLKLLPETATYRPIPGDPADDDLDDDDVRGRMYVIHYWEDARDRVRASSTRPTAPIRKSTN